MATSRNMPRALPKKPSSSEKPGLGMLLFESVSAGAVAVLLALAAVLLLVGIYAYVVWPWTHWNLENVNVDQLRSWWQYALGLIFTAGTAIGFWCFSGMAFRGKPSQRGAVAKSRLR